MKFGLVLPHFGPWASPEYVLDGSVLAERHGFDSVWVRDHVVFEPHGEMEGPDLTFYEALTTLTAIGALTSTLQLGTGAMIPSRHPLMTAQIAATMTNLFGPRLVLGCGAGAFDHEFESIGLGGRDRVELVRSNIAVFREIFSRNTVTYRDEYVSFENVSIEPKPPGGHVPLWYCGATPRAARLAVEFCDGWMPGRIGIDSLRARIATVRELSEHSEREVPTIAVVVPTSVEVDRETALKHVNVPGLLAWANNAKFAIRPPSGRFATVDDLAGQLIAGSPDDAIEFVRDLETVGVKHVIFDLRFKFECWFDQIEAIGSGVISPMRASDSSVAEPHKKEAGRSHGQ
jgi:alkanesulfonate monooxygenase SsuD/methylene tetrahydromethanopterin reductase-like flavin-dependent oxidoreductase (luciferase family)